MLKWAPLVNAYRSVGFMASTLIIAQLCARWRRRAQPRHVPLIITSAVVLSCLAVLILDWGFSQMCARDRLLFGPHVASGCRGPGLRCPSHIHTANDSSRYVRLDDTPLVGATADPAELYVEPHGDGALAASLDATAPSEPAAEQAQAEAEYV